MLLSPPPPPTPREKLVFILENIFSDHPRCKNKHRELLIKEILPLIKNLPDSQIFNDEFISFQSSITEHAKKSLIDLDSDLSCLQKILSGFRKGYRQCVNMQRVEISIEPKHHISDMWYNHGITKGWLFAMMEIASNRAAPKK